MEREISDPILIHKNFHKDIMRLKYKVSTSYLNNLEEGGI